MPLKYIACPSNAGRALAWAAEVGAGHCHVVGPGGTPWSDCPTYEALLARLPEGWRPDFALVDLSYPSLPPWLWDAPLPLVALAPDWELQWPLLTLALPRCALAFSDRAGTHALNAAGHAHVRGARLFGLRPPFDGPPADPPPARDIDVLFVGSLNPAVQGERLPWLMRLARLSAGRKVMIATGVFGDDYRRLLLRARIVFNRSLHGEENQRVAEAASHGCLVLQERGNAEMAGAWRDGVHCAYYGDDDFEAVIGRYLDDEGGRAEVAARGDALARGRSWADEWGRLKGVVEADWDAIKLRHAALTPMPAHEKLLLRSWQALGAQHPADDALPADLDAALDDGVPWAALALSTLAGDGDAGRATRWLHAALGLAPSSVLVTLGLVEATHRMGVPDVAADGARRLLTSLLERGVPAGEALWPLSDPSFGPFRMAWLRAAIRHAGEPHARDAERTRLVRWRLHSLLASVTGDLAHHHEAALAWPDAPKTRASLGCALGKAGRPADAAHHLKAELDANPFDAASARALFQAYNDAGLGGRAARLAHDRRLLATAAPGIVPVEPWSADAQAEAPHGSLVLALEGPLFEVASLAHVNRRVALGLASRGHTVLAREVRSAGPRVAPGPEADALAALCRAGGHAPVTVRHAWPPDPTPPASGHWVLMQPWEFGSVPRAWLPMLARVDEVWAPTSSVRQAFLDAGVPEDRARVVPLGADHTLFRPGVEPMTLPTRKAVKVLYVGGTIPRKGFDVLLSAYGRAFRSTDGVCLVVKGMGASSFYRGQTADDEIRAFQAAPGNPEVLTLDGDMADAEMASLYAACDVLALPYRGEGFGLPLAEAMSSGLPVVATGMGACLDFVDDTVGWLVPARRVDFNEQKAGGMETCGTPWLAEPDAGALALILREAAFSPAERAKRGAAGRARVERGLTWGHTLDAVESALRRLRHRPVRRLADAPPVPAAATEAAPASGPSVAVVNGQEMALHDPARDLWVSRPLLEGEPYEHLALSALRRLVRPGDTVIDVGANVGVYTLRLAHLVGPSGRVFAVEPEPGNLALLRENVERNGHANVTVLPVAASDHDGEAELSLSPDNQGDHRVIPGAGGRASVPVRAARLDGLLADAGPVSLIKLDVQGAEGLALAGLERTLARSPDAALLFELWPWGLEAAGTPAPRLLSWLSARGYTFEALDERNGHPVHADPDGLIRALPAADERAFVNVLARRGARAGDTPVVVRALKPGAALCIIARDEESNIGACIDSAGGLFPQVVVLDTGSKDRTVEIALSKGAEVHHFTWVDDFSAARNECLRHADREWIFWLDADDRLDAENRLKLKALLESLPDGDVAYSMKCRCLPDETGAATLVDHLRLFRNGPHARWEYRIHEQILPSLKRGGAEVREADVVIDHTGYVDPALRGRKLERDLRILRAQHRDLGDEPFTLFYLAQMALDLGDPQGGLRHLHLSLRLSSPGDSIVRKLHSLRVRALLEMGRPRDALDAALLGLRVCPGDPELTMREARLRSAEGDHQGARAALLGLIDGAEGGGLFRSVSEGLRTFMARHELARVCLALGGDADAEAQWRRACAEAPLWRPPWVGLAGLLCSQGRWGEMGPVLDGMARTAGPAGEPAWWRGKALLDSGDVAGAVTILGGAAAAHPSDPGVRLLHASALEQSGDLGGAERQLAEAAALCPHDGRIRAVLDRLRGMRGARDGASLPPGTPPAA